MRQASGPRGVAQWIPALVLFFGLLYGWSTIQFWTGGQGNLDASGHAIGRDFVIFWEGARAAGAGEAESIFVPELFLERLRSEMGPGFPLHFWSYPPPALFFVWPFGFEPYLLAYGVWAITTLALLLTAVAVFRGDRRVVVAMLLAPSTSINLAIGQNGYLTGAFAVGGWALVRSRPVLAGILLGLLSFKPQLGVLMPFALIAMRAWKTVLSAALTTAALFAASFPAFGIESWRNFLQRTVPFQLEFMRIGEGPFQWKMPTVFMAGRILGLSPDASWWIQWALLPPAAWLTYRVFRTDAPLSLKVAVLFCATFLSSPQLMNYDMALTSLAAIILVTDPRRPPDTAELLVAGLVWLLPWTVMSLNPAGWPLGPLVLAGLLVVLVRRSFRASGPDPVPPAPA